MSIFKGTTQVVDRFKGSTLIGKVYKGSTLIFDAFTDVSGTLPLTYTSRASQVLKNYRLHGTSAGSGVATGNLWNETYPNISSTIKYTALNVGDGTFTLSTTTPRTSTSAANLFFFGGDVSTGAATQTNGVWNTQSRTVEAVDGYVTIAYRVFGDIDPQDYKTMLNSGSMAAEYEPAGYKIPLTNNSTDYTLFIGDSKLGADDFVDYASQKVYRLKEIAGLSESLCGIGNYKDFLDLSTGTVTRAFEKTVLTGNEDNLYYYGIFSGHYFSYIDFYPAGTVIRDAVPQPLVCSHFKETSVSQSANFTCRYKGDSGRYEPYRVYLVNDAVRSLSDFKQFLATEYANGTPVTIWHLRSSPITEQVSVPLGYEGVVDGWMIQDGTPTPSSPIYPETNGTKQANDTYTVVTPPQPTDPPSPLPAISAVQGENILSSTETVGTVTVKGRIKEADQNP